MVVKDPAPVQAPAPSLSYRDVYVPTSTGPTRGVFAQAFGDIEWRKGLTLDGGEAGALTSRQKTGGFNAGTDWQVGNNGAGATKLFFGVLGTVTSSNTDFGDSSFRRPIFDNGVEIGSERVRVEGAEEHVQGGGAGVYGFLTANSFSADFLAKIEGFGLDRQDRTIVDNTGPCGFAEVNSASRRSTVDLTTSTLAANIAYRFEFSGNMFIEPTFGVRYTHTDFGSAEGNLPLGFRDGDAFRIQGGARVGIAGLLPNGDVGVVALTGLLYNDVAITGFSAVNSGGFNPAEIDEGETRALGQLSMSIVQQSGWTYTAQGEVRGGDDLRAFGGKFLMRYDW